jgi:hypothetical protein
MEALEAAAAQPAPPPPAFPSGTRLPGFVSGGTVAPGAPPPAGLGPGAAAAATAAAAGPEDIDLDDDGEPVAAPQERAVPAGVFGGLAAEGEPPAKRAREGE